MTESKVSGEFLGDEKVPFQNQADKFSSFKGNVAEESKQDGLPLHNKETDIGEDIDCPVEDDSLNIINKPYHNEEGECPSPNKETKETTVEKSPTEKSKVKQNEKEELENRETDVEDKEKEASPQKRTKSVDSKAEEQKFSTKEDSEWLRSQDSEAIYRRIDGKKDFRNAEFYLNKLLHKKNGVFIETMLEKWRGDYDRLEDDHDYIQWLFPNFFKSMFNPMSFSLGEEEAVIFRHNREVADRLVRAYSLILDFYGMRLTDTRTGKIERGEHYVERYGDALLTFYHNHLRIRRILTHLNNVGFRRYAIELVNFLEKEIYGEVGAFELFLDKSPRINKELANAAPLRKLRSVRGTFEVWVMYGDHNNDPDRIKLLEKNCFTKYPEGFVDSVFFENA